MIMWMVIFTIISLVLICEMIFFHHKITTVEIIIQICVPLVVTPLFSVYLKHNFTLDYELWNNYIQEVVHEERWNEYINQTCSRSVASGTDSNGNTTYTTEFYDCSYVANYPENWVAYLNDTSEVVITESHYNRLVKLFNNKRKSGHNSGYTISGDIFSSVYDNKYEHLQPYSSKYAYKNKIPVSTSVFNFEKIEKEEAEKLGLYKWYDNKLIYNKDKFNVSHIFGSSRCESLERLNAYYGMKHQINVIVLVYDDKPMSIFEKQKAYWYGGNKNELILGFGIKDGKVEWCDNFTWSESYEFLAELKNEQEKQLKKKLDVDLIADWLYDEIPTGWKRKEFKDFEYIEIEYPMWYSVTIVSICLLFSLIVSVVSIFNDQNAGYDENSVPNFITKMKEKYDNSNWRCSWKVR